MKNLERNFWLRMAWILIRAAIGMSFVVWVYKDSETPRWMKESIFWSFVLLTYLSSVIISIDEYSKELHSESNKMLSALNKIMGNK